MGSRSQKKDGTLFFPGIQVISSVQAGWSERFESYLPFGKGLRDWSVRAGVAFDGRYQLQAATFMMDEQFFQSLGWAK